MFNIFKFLHKESKEPKLKDGAIFQDVLDPTRKVVATLVWQDGSYKYMYEEDLWPSGQKGEI